MAAGKYSFIIEQGATVDFEIVYKNPNSTPVVLDGYTASMQIKSAPGGTIYASLSGSSENTFSQTASGSYISLKGSNNTTPLTSGSIGIFIGHAVTNDFNFGEAVYDLELENDQVKTRLLEGKVQLSKQVTTI